jgi:xylulokinase
MKDFLLTFDIGTTGVKAGLFNPNGNLVETTYQEYGVLYPAPQWIEQSIDEMWKAACKTSRELIKKMAVDPNDIAAIGISSQRATFVPVDENEQPLMNFIGWQDKRSIAQCDYMKELIGPELYYQIAGLPIDPTAAVSKILWIKENLPDIFDKTHKFASTQNVHLHQLGVENTPCDLADAAYLGLLDVDRLKWSDELLEKLEIPKEKMPQLAPSGVKVGELSSKAASELGLVKGIPIVTAGGDLQVAGVGLGITQPGHVSVGIGTGGGVLIYLDEPLRHPTMAMNCLPHAVENAWEMEGICLASGAAYKWLRDTLYASEKEIALKKGIDPYQLLNKQAALVPPGSDGVLIMPSFMGAGSPNWYPKARGVILGLTLATEKKTLIRAMLEGICLEIRWMLEEAEKLGSPIKEVRIWGGAAKSHLWNQIAADIYGIPASLTEIREVGLVGAAILAGYGINMFNSVEEGVDNLVKVTERYQPNLDLKALYDEKFTTYKNTYNTLSTEGIFEQIAGQAGQI